MTFWGFGISSVYHHRRAALSPGMSFFGFDARNFYWGIAAWFSIIRQWISSYHNGYINTVETNSPRILLVRLSAIGDVIQALPVACALRERFPKAFLAWLVEERAAALLRAHEAIDELITVPRYYLKSPRAVWQLRRRLRQLRFDVALDAQGLSKSAFAAWLSAAPRRIGFGKPWGREISPWINTELVDTAGLHIIERNLKLLSPLGIESARVRFQVPEDPAARENAEHIIRRHMLEEGFAIINPGAGWPSKLWPLDRYAAVAAHLGNAWNLPALVIWAGAKEKQMAQSIVEGSEGQARLAPNTTLAELAALARRTRLFIGSDTGPLHLAAAVGARCVGLYGPWPAAIHGPYGPQNIALQKAFFQGPTHKRRNASLEYMEAITIEDVCQACDEILQKSGVNSFRECSAG
jgi:heptosyltransferase-1